MRTYSALALWVAAALLIQLPANVSVKVEDGPSSVFLPPTQEKWMELLTLNFGLAKHWSLCPSIEGVNLWVGEISLHFSLFLALATFSK